MINASFVCTRPMDWKWRGRRLWMLFKRYCQSLRWDRCRSAIALGIILVIFLVTKLLHSSKIICSNREIYNHISRMCDKYRQGLILGDLCPDFCTDPSQIEVDSCQTQHFGKEVVFSALWKHSNPVFVKELVSDWSDSDQMQPVYTLSESGDREYPDISDFQFMVESYMEDNYDLPSEGNLMERLWNLPLANDENEDAYIHTAMDTIWALLQNGEYVFSQLYKHYDIFPEVYGSCGSLYVVEKVEQRLPDIKFWGQPSFDEWTQRVDLAVRLLDLVEEFESLFEEPVYICDVKPEHFGLSPQNRMKLLDVDTLSLKSVADRTVGNGEKCEKHSDCDYLDCRGQCDLVEGKCSGEVTNNNLQMICEDILSQGHSMLGLNYPGLLTSKHMHKRLRGLLKQCANPSNAKDGTRIGADSKIHTELYRMLKEISNISQKIKNTSN